MKTYITLRKEFLSMTGDLLKTIPSKTAYASEFDLKRRYHHVDILVEHQTFLGFWWRKWKYEEVLCFYYKWMTVAVRKNSLYEYLLNSKIVEETLKLAYLVANEEKLMYGFHKNK